MRGSLPAFPQLGWFGYHRDLLPDRRHVVRNSHLCIKVVVHADARVDWITGGRERRYETATGGVGIWPADGQDHTFVIAPPRPGRSFVLLIPPGSLMAAAAAEGIDVEPAGRPRYVLFDASLRRSVLDVVDDVVAGRGAATPARDERFRLLALRLVEVMTGHRPDWHHDEGGFTEPILERIVARVDESLAAPPSLTELAMVAGLSPGHFARKVRASTGMSLGRLIHQRRIRTALARMRDRDVSMSHLAVELGFDSQSHFTRVFRALTGLTPARFRREILG
jgi:AraC-like DNA-binding protein